MSSEASRTSSSSRLSQFGLYRTIDARTEEFLKLSKKRQIRQGCACAVISTAITVTVVVAVILIYEYNGSLDIIKHEKQSLKCTNATKNAKGNSSQEEHKGNKKSHTINLSTIKLLNLLLRALNHTQNFENQIENSPTTNKPAATEQEIPFERNVFSNSKNWIRIPSIRMLAGEHKEPSIISYKNPTSNVKLTPNARNTPTYFGMDLHSEEILDKRTKSSIKIKHQAIPVITETITAPPKSQKPIQVHCADSEGQNKSCNCSKLNVFMCRLLSNIQELFPGIILNTTLCIANNSDANKPKMTALKPFHKHKVIKTTSAPQVSKKNETTTSNYGRKIFDEATFQNEQTTESITEKYQKYLDITTIQYTATESITEKYQKKLDKTANTSVHSNKSGSQDAAQNKIKSLLQSIIHTTKQPSVTTTAVRTYILVPDVVEYKLPTTTPCENGSQYETTEKIQATKSLELQLVDTNKTSVYNQEYYVENRNKSTDATKSQVNQYKISDKKQELVIIDEVTSKNVLKAYQKYSVKNTNKLSNASKSGHQHNFQRPKIFLKGQFQPVTTKSTTTATRPCILAPELVKHIEPFTKSSTSTTTSTVATTTIQNKINHNSEIEKLLYRITESTVKPTRATTTTKHFIDNPYLAIKPFNKIKFARFDSFAAHPNKRVILPLYKDINFDLFPVYKRHNTPKFDGIEKKKDEKFINSDNLNNPGTDNDLTDIDSSNKRDDNVSTLNMLSINSSKSRKENSAGNGILAIKMINDSSEERTKEEISETYNNANLPKSSSIEEKHAIWTYSIDNDYDDNNTKIIGDNEITQPETLNEPMKKNIMFDTKTNKSESSERTVSISQLYDADESLQNYLSRIIPLKTTEEKNKHLLNNISHTVEAKFFEDRIQEKLRSHMDSTSKVNEDPDNTMHSVIPIEVLVDETKYNPLSMLPKSRPSYLEINRNFLGEDHEQNYQKNKENFKPKRQDYDIVFDLFE